MLYDARASARVVAVTTTACSSEKPGRERRSRCRPRSPGSRPCDQAYSTASQKAQPSTPWSVPPPRLRLMTSAPWSAAQRIPAATSSAEPVAVHAPPPSQLFSSTRTASRPASGATPATPAAVVGGGQRDAGHVGAVAVVVLARARARAGVAVGADAADVAGELAARGPRGRGRRPESTTAMVMPVAGALGPRARARRCARGPTGAPARTRDRSASAPPGARGRDARRSARARHRRRPRAIGRTGASTHHRSDPAAPARRRAGRVRGGAGR